MGCQHCLYLPDSKDLITKKRASIAGDIVKDLQDIWGDWSQDVFIINHFINSMCDDSSDISSESRWAKAILFVIQEIVFAEVVNNLLVADSFKKFADADGVVLGGSWRWLTRILAHRIYTRFIFLKKYFFQNKI